MRHNSCRFVFIFTRDGSNTNDKLEEYPYNVTTAKELKSQPGKTSNPGSVAREGS